MTAPLRNPSCRGLATTTTPTSVEAATESLVASAPSSSSSSSSTSLRPLAYWLLGTGTIVAGMVTIGGVTRLTKSGLSMTDWKVQVRTLWE
jgi:cytochrome c oxidase assembly protein subunit 15